MGSVVAAIKEKATQNLNWIAGRDEGEYEIEEPSDSESEKQNASTSRDSSDDKDEEAIKDPILELRKPEFKEALLNVGKTFAAKKAPVFDLEIPPNMVLRFKDFINWVNQTSDSRYVVTSGSNNIHHIIRHPHVKVNFAIEEKAESETIETQTLTDIDEPETVPFVGGASEKSEATNRSDKEESRDLTTSASVIIRQLRLGIIVPPLRQSGKRRKITLNSLNLSENEVVNILKREPGMDMVGLMKKIYSKKSKWTFMNNMYNFKLFTPCDDT